jgi:TonB family protein
MQRVAIAARLPLQEGRTTGEAEGSIGEASQAVTRSGPSGQGGTASGVGGLAQAPGPGGGSSEKERDHRIAIIRRRIEEALVYPREARRRGIEGTSQVRFDLTDAGRLRTLVLARSSGRKLLDDASLTTVERAQPFPFVDGTLIVPVVFRLSGMSRP